MRNIVVLVSGAGTTLNAIAQACEDGIIKARVATVISDRVGCGATEVAKRHGIVPFVQIPKTYGKKGTDFYGRFTDEEHSRKMLSWAEFSEPALVICAGYIQRLVVTPKWEGKILNIHPSLLPKYGGKGMYGHYVYQAVLDAKEEWTGCTAHVVDNEYDHGMILAQSRVRVHPDDTLVSLAGRVQEAERAMYPLVIQSYLEGWA